MENKKKRIMEIMIEVGNLMNNFESSPRLKELIFEYDKLVAESKIKVVD